jgi:hypothetical protein
MRLTDLTPAVWGEVKLVRRPESYGHDAVDVAIRGDGTDLRKLVAERLDVFAALLELRPGDE